MKQFCRRLCALLSALALLCTGVFAAEPEQTERTEAPHVLTKADYAAADDIFARINRLETARRSAGSGLTVDQVYELVSEADGVEEGSVTYAGAGRVEWYTEDGIACAYSTHLRELFDYKPAEPTDTPEITVKSFASKAGTHNADVYVFQPYYGIDYSFTEQYAEEGERVAEAAGGTSYRYITNAATVDRIADAIESGAVVIFDSHGDTNYDNGWGDYTTRATRSYLCLQSGEGLTDEDYKDEHAYYGGTYGDMSQYEVDGTVLANHMDKPAGGGLLWNAICLGMATDAIEAPLMEKGIGAVYGYSQSVTFLGDYCYEEAFFDRLTQGGTVAESISYMKSVYGNWDCSYQICQATGMSDPAYTYEEALMIDAAFPIVVSDEDEYPGHGNVDAVQTVYSGWLLLDQYEVTVRSGNEAWGSAVRNGATVTATPAEGYYTVGATVEPSDAATLTRSGDTFRISNLTRDCVITVEFAARTPALLSFSVPSGVTQEALSGYVGDTVTLPTPEGLPDSEGRSYHFLGWTAEETDNETTAPTYYRAGTTYPLSNGTETLYALYTYFETPDGAAPTFTRLTEAPEDWTGYYALTAQDAYLLRADGTPEGSSLGDPESAVPFAEAGVQLSGDSLLGLSGAFAVEILPVSAEQCSIRLLGAQTPTYLACRSNATQLNTAGNANATTARWTLSFADGVLTIRNARYPARALQFNAQNGYFRCDTAAQTPVTLFRGPASCAMYFTTLIAKDVPHEHTYTEKTRVEPTCTEDGYVEYVCDCGESYHETLPAIGHDWDEGEITTPATCETDGVKTFTCKHDETHTYTEPVAALGHEFGAWTETKPATCTEDGTRTRTCARCDREQTEAIPAIACPTDRFSDNPHGKWYHDAVDCMVNGGYMGGMSEGVFAPDGRLTRGELVTILYRIAGEPEVSGTSRFTDVAPNRFYAKAVLWAEQNGVVNGATETTFAPNDRITREQIATILYRYAKAEPVGQTQLAGFTDGANVSSYARDAMSWAVANGLFNGDNGRLLPKNDASRAEIAAILMRALRAGKL